MKLRRLITKRACVPDCCNCGYQLRGLTDVVCPECGFTNDSDHIAMLQNRRWCRRIVVIGAFVMVAVSVCLVLPRTGMFLPNVGLRWGYYGELNRTKSRIRAIDGVTIVNVRANYDLQVEDFTIDVIVDGTHSASIYIPDSSVSHRLSVVDHWEKGELPALRNR